MTSGAYLALRRGAAGLSPADVDAMLRWQPGTMARIEAQLRRPSQEWLDCLHGAFPFDPIIARRLGEGSPVQICTGCGCSQMDPCYSEAEGSCYWATRALCSSCRDSGVLG